MTAKLAKIPAPEITLTLAQASSELGVSRARVYQLMRAGRLPSWKTGGRVLVSPTDVESLHQELLEANHPPVPMPEPRHEASAATAYLDPRLVRLERQEADYAALESELSGAPEVSLEPAILGVVLALAAMAAVSHFSPKPV